MGTRRDSIGFKLFLETKNALRLGAFLEFEKLQWRNLKKIPIVISNPEVKSSLK